MSFLNADAVNLNIGGNSAYSVLKNFAAMAADLGYINGQTSLMQTLLLREQNHPPVLAPAWRKFPRQKQAAGRKTLVLFARSTMNID